MLVLSRKMGERIHIGEDIVLEVRRIAGNRVTLALAAPRHVRILRGELDTPAREFHDTEREHAIATPALSLPPRITAPESLTPQPVG
jgi:carbon storage regulator CsrA